VHHTRLFLVSICLIACLSSAPASTSEYQSVNGSYTRRVWRNGDGLPEDFAQSIAQTPDGYLWVGTSGGLVRFDGASFAVFNREQSPAFRDESIYCLQVTRDGTLWAGTEGGGLIRYKDHLFRAFGVDEGLTNGFVRVIFEDSARRLWVGTDAGLFQLENEKFTRIDEHNGIPHMSVHAICEDKAGRILFGGWGLLIVKGTEKQYYNSSESQADNSIRTLCQTRSGDLWIGTIAGLRRLPSGETGNPFLHPKIFSQINISVLRESKKGQLWIGSYGQGLLRFENGRTTTFTAPNLLPHNNVLALFEDAEENVWVGTHGGLLRLSPSLASTITSADGIPQSINTIYHDPRGELLVTALNGQLFRVADQVLVPVQLPSSLHAVPLRNVFRDSRGALWMGTDGQGIARIDGGRVARFTTREGLGSDFTRAFCEDADRNLWIGTDGGLSRYSGSEFRNFNVEDGLAYSSVRALLLDSTGSVWVATDGGLSRFRNGKFQNESALERLRGRKVWSLHEDPSGGLWIGTHGDGLFWLKHGELSQFTSSAGLPSNKIHFIAEDARGNLWLSGPNGILSVARKALEDFANRAKSQLAVRVYSTAQGLSTNQMNGGVQPAGALLPSGELWIPSAKGAVRLIPDGGTSRNPPPVFIEQVLVDDHSEPLSENLRLSTGRHKLEIHYTAIRLGSPDDLRFRYRLEGFDPEWTDVGRRRVAYYTNVPAGSYLFRVEAYEIDDPRTVAGHSISIAWRPYAYETPWFLSLCVLATIAAAWGGYRLHIHNLRKRFTAVLEERNRLAREMHDTLIQGAVGVSTLLEAASGARAISPAVSDELLERARNEVRSTVDEARLAVWNLRHPTGAGLVAAVTHLARQTERETGIPVNVESEGTPLVLTPDSERSLLMIIREALQNALRHATPKHVSIRMHFGRQGLQVEVEDDGTGFHADQALTVVGRHYGLIGMRERAEKLGGKLHFTSSVGRGTLVDLQVPWPRT